VIIIELNCQQFTQCLLCLFAYLQDHAQPKPGDLIEISRETFYHWAIYVGDGYVIHLTTLDGLPSSHSSLAGSSSTVSDSNQRGIVKKEILLDVVGTSTFCVKNHLDNMHKPRSVSTILSDAESRVGKTVPYDVFQYNCEHFVTELRYDKPESRQVQQAAEVVGPAMFGGGLLGAIAAFASVIVMRLLRIS
uniref:Retinoic acid receptor responder protein 3-like n=1 Tax=Paramormyrops kingsleyae TaxID=1676925 RepID=A0A3B3Q408_9TELE